MKRIITLLSICFVFQVGTSTAQKLVYENTSPWFWGLNAGGTWNTADVKYKLDWGWGVTLGRSFNFNYGKPISFDLRGRYLGGNWKGQDFDSTGFALPNAALSAGNTNYKDSLGYSVLNHKTKVHELDLELVLHLNRLVERTGWDPYIFGGIGLTWSNTKGNLLNTADSLYDYNSLESLSRSSITGLLDDSYETTLDGSTADKYNIAAMPSLGFGLGYFFGPRFSMGLEHKTTFTLADNFDGYADPAGKRENDWYHYTSVYFKYYFKSREGRSAQVKPPVVPPTTGPIQPGQTNCPKPIIGFANLTNNQNLTNSNLSLLANLTNVADRANITVSINGNVTSNYSYNATTGKLDATGVLQVGQNTISITASNTCGSTTESIIVNYNLPCQQPIVAFTNPSNTGTTVSSNVFYVTADILNLLKNEGVVFKVNGVSVTNYSFSYSTGKFSATVSLKSGQNTIEISATNTCGTANGSTVVMYSQNCPAPVIESINVPNGTTVQNEMFNFEATLANVIRANQVSLTLNGVAQSAGQFNTSTRLYQKALRLAPGQNIIVLQSVNDCSSANQTIVVNLQVPCVSPVVTIKTPASPGLSVSNATYYVTADILNMNGSQNIVFRVNGIQLSSYTFNAQTGAFNSTISLQQGANKIEIYATNACGTSSDLTVLNYNYTCPQPTIQFLKPAQSLSVSEKQYTIQALVTNVTSASQIQLKINGVLQSAGTYNSVNSLYEKMVNLSVGKNDIELIATNACGTVNATNTITYREVVNIEPKPVISMTSVCDATVEPGQQYVSGLIANVQNSNQVTITVNGLTQGNVNYAAVSQGLNFGFYLNAQSSPDTYVIVISAQNSGGVTSKTCVIKVNKPDENITICTKINGVPTTKVIKLSQWPQYQAQGATLGACPVIDNDITICVKINGVATTKVIKESQWPQYQAQGATLGACPVIDNDITICVKINGVATTKVIKQSQWPQYQAQGATLGACPVIDNDMTICVLINNKPTTKVIKESQWPQYQAQGATLGACPPVVDNDIVICVTINGKRMTKTIKQSEWPQYQAQGATLGACPPLEDKNITICAMVNKVPTTLVIKESQWAQYQAMGATMGACPPVQENDLTICYTVKGVPTTTTIKESQWPQYQALGATLGACPPVVDNNITICTIVNGAPTTLVIKESQWPQYQSQGAIMGACPPVVDNDLTICTTVNGVPTTLVIKESQWPGYQTQGAIIGICPPVVPVDTSVTIEDTSTTTVINPMWVICVLENGVYVTKTIPVSEWAAYYALGATKGACPPDPNKSAPSDKPKGKGNDKSSTTKPVTKPVVKPEEKPGGSQVKPRKP